MNILQQPCLQLCTLYDASPHYGHILIDGPDATAFLHRLTSNDVKELPVGQGHFNSLLTHKGKVLSLFYLFRESPEKFMIFVPKDILDKTLTLLTKMKFREKITLKNISAERELLFLIGANAPVEAQKLNIPQLIKTPESFDDTPYIMISYPSELKKDVFPHLAHLPSFSEEAFEVLRVLSRFPKYGIDLTEDNILLESPVPIAYKRQKGCYPGQEVIERISAYGKGRTPTVLSLLSCEGSQSFPTGTPITSGENTAGHVTSAVFDPLNEKTWVLGYVEQKFISENSCFNVGAGSPRPESYHPIEIKLVS